MKRFAIVILVLVTMCSTIVAFVCPNPNGRFENPDDYRSFYVCSNNCWRLEYCALSKEYFSNANQKCTLEPTDWQPEFDVTGSMNTGSSMIYHRQDGYDFVLAHDHSFSRDTISGRYINKTHIIGVLTRQIWADNCIAVFNVRYIARKDRSICAQEIIHHNSPSCNLNDVHTFCSDY